jgi:signal transduction histidine kinase
MPAEAKMDDLNYVIGATNLLLDEIVRTIDQLKTDRDNISHDLTTPLNAIRMTPKTLLEDNDGGADFFSTSAQQVLNNLDRAMTTINTLLHISDVLTGTVANPVDNAIKMALPGAAVSITGKMIDKN